MKTTDGDIKNLIKKICIADAPESNLVVKKTIVKRESGAFNKLKDGTAVLTRDNYLYVFEWNLLSQEGQQFTEPKIIINLNNLLTYEVKKDMRVEIIESKKGLFSNQKKSIIKPLNMEDLEDWVHIFDRFK